MGDLLGEAVGFVPVFSYKRLLRAPAISAQLLMILSHNARVDSSLLLLLSISEKSTVQRDLRSAL